MLGDHMRTKPAYLIIDSDRKTIVRSTQRWPTLYPGEIVVRVRLEIPDHLIPQVQEITVDDIDAMVRVEPVPIEHLEEA